MIYIGDTGNSSVHGDTVDIMAQYLVLTRDLAEELGKDFILEAVVLGLYAHNREQMDYIHDKLKEGGLEV